MPAGMAQPGDADPHAETGVGHSLAQAVHDPDDLMTWNYGKPRIGEFTIEHVQVCSADRASFDPHSNFARGRRELRPLLKNQSLPHPMKDHGPHRSISPL